MDPKSQISNPKSPILLQRDSRGYLLCPLCKTARLFMNYEKKPTRIAWFYQCKVCEGRFWE